MAIRSLRSWGKTKRQRPPRKQYLPQRVCRCATLSRRAYRCRHAASSSQSKSLMSLASSLAPSARLSSLTRTPSGGGVGFLAITSTPSTNEQIWV